MRLVKRIFCFILVLIFILTIGFRPIKAEAAAAGAVGSVLAAAIISVFAACGLDFIFSGLDSGGVVSSIGDLVSDYLSALGHADVEAWLGLNPISSVSNGTKLVLGAATINKLWQFASWVQQQYSIISNGSDVTISSVSESGFYLSDGTFFQFSDWYGAGDSRTVYRSNVMDYSSPITLDNGTVITWDSSSFSIVNGNSSYSYSSLNSGTLGIYICLPATASVDRYISYTYGSLYSDTYGGVSFYRANQITNWNTWFDAIDNVSSTVINPGTVSIPEALADTNAVVIDIADELVAADTNVIDYILDNAAAGTVADTAVTVTSAEDVEQDIADENFTNQYGSPGLTSVFPFCIPFDVYNFLSLLVANREAPEVRIPLQYSSSIVSVDEELVIDFSQYETVASVLRTVELLVFIIGLAFVTRSMFIRG